MILSHLEMKYFEECRRIWITSTEPGRSQFGVEAAGLGTPSLPDTLRFPAQSLKPKAILFKDTLECRAAQQRALEIMTRLCLALDLPGG